MFVFEARQLLCLSSLTTHN